MHNVFRALVETCLEHIPGSKDFREVSKQMLNAVCLLFQPLNKRLARRNFSTIFMLNGFLQSIKLILFISAFLTDFGLLPVATIGAKKRLVDGGRRRRRR